MNFVKKLKKGLEKTRTGMSERINKMLASFGKIDEELYEELEEILITSDIGMKTVNDIIEKLRIKVREDKITKTDEIYNILKNIIKDMLYENFEEISFESDNLIVLMVIGVNGTGKTTSIGKISNLLIKKKKKVVIAAADTFRAAASDQLLIWAERSGASIVKHSEGADPGAVLFDAVQSAKSKKADFLICDTAGRLHTKTNLMNELKKLFRIIDRELPGCKKEVLLAVDASTGQNALSQAKTFNEACGITGLILTKLDGTAKGGIVITISNELNIPVKLVGVGEQIDDLQYFNPGEYTEALF